jgi:hypothetical protein
VVFLLTIKFHGTWETAKAINQPLINLWFFIDPRNLCNCYQYSGASIDAIAWTSKEALQLGKNVLKHFSLGIWVPLAWIITILSVFLLIINFLKDSHNINNTNKAIFIKEDLISILILQFIIIFPLFIIGWDYGRWIYIWVLTSITLFSFGFKVNEALPFIPNKFLPMKYLNFKILNLFL